MPLFDDLLEAVKKAIAHAKGEDTGAVEHKASGATTDKCPSCLLCKNYPGNMCGYCYPHPEE